MIYRASLAKPFESHYAIKEQDKMLRMQTYEHHTAL